MLLNQLQSIISKDNIPEKEEKVRKAGERIATIIEKIADSVSAPEQLRAQATSLRNTTAQPNTSAEVSEIVKMTLGLLQGISQPVSQTVPAEPEKKPRAIEPTFLRDRQVIEIIEANSTVTVSKKEPMPGLFRQATRLAQRILDGVYGDELRERLCDALISPEDVLLLLLLDGAYHHNELSEVELFKNSAQEKELGCLQDLHGCLDPKKIATVILGAQDKSELPESKLWLHVVSSAYKLCNPELMKAILAHMFSFHQPTQTQLLQILLASDDAKVKADVQRFAETRDSEVGTKAALLLSALEKKDGADALSFIRGSTSEAELEPAFARALAQVASRRPDFVLSTVESFYSSDETGLRLGLGLLAPDDDLLLNRLYLAAARVALLKVASDGDLDDARALIDSVQRPLAKSMAQAAFVEAFRRSHPEHALDMLFSRWAYLNSAPPSPSEQLAFFVEERTAKEALAFWPQVQGNKKASEAFLSAVLIQAAQRNMGDAIAILQNRADIWESPETMQYALKELSNRLGGEDTDISRIRQLLDVLPPQYRDNVCAEFLSTCISLSVQDQLALLSEMSDTQQLIFLCNNVFAYRNLLADLTHKTVIDAILAKIPMGQDRDRVLTDVARAYAYSGKEPEVEEAFSLLSAISEQKSRGQGLVTLAHTFNDIPGVSLDTSSKWKYVRRALAEATAFNAHAADAIRSLMWDMMVQDPQMMAQMIAALEIGKELQDAAQRNMGDAIAILQDRTDIWESPETMQYALKELSHRLGEQDTDTSRIRQLLDALPPQYRNNVCAEFLSTCISLSVQDQLALLSEMNDTQQLIFLCNNVFAYRNLLADLTHKTVIDAILAKIPMGQDRDSMLVRFAKVYAHNGKEPEIEEAFSLLSAISEQKSRGRGLSELAHTFNDIPDVFLDISSKWKYVRRALAEATTCDDDAADGIRLLMVGMTMKDPSQMMAALQIAKEIQNDWTFNTALLKVFDAALDNYPPEERPEQAQLLRIACQSAAKERAASRGL